MLITDKKTLKAFERELDTDKKNGIFNRETDTRIQLKIYKQNDVEILCIDEWTLINAPRLYTLLKNLKVVNKLDYMENEH